MAQKKFTQLPAASALDGTEILAAVQGGVSVRTTTQDAANLSALTSLTVDTAPGTFDFNFELKTERIFVCEPSFTGFKTINLSNFANARAFRFIIDISTGGAILSFTSIGSGIRMDDVRWSLSPDIWFEPGEGKFLGEATYDGTDWFVKISGGPYTKT
jgi:hypothetical protein